MGQAGWIPIDPTTGEFETMSATHIKLFEGMGGVLPEHVKVTAFQPPNRIVPVVAPKGSQRNQLAAEQTSLF